MNIVLLLKKKESYLKWKLIHSKLLDKNHITNRLEIIELSKQINKQIKIN